MNPVGKTSLLVAAMRAMETKRTDIEGRLFSDPYAELLAGAEGAELLRKAIQESGDQPAIAIRTHFIDEKTKEALQQGLRQIVILAAGMDARAYRLDFPEGTHIFELDRKEVLDYKREKLYNVRPRCEHQELAVDLREDWRPLLRQAGFKSGAPTLWLVEGLLMYLEEPQVLALLEKINTMASSGDVMLFDILSQTLIEAPHMKKQLQFLENMGAPWRFGTNEPEEFMKKLGWQAVTTQAGEFAPKRWPFPTAPRHIPNVPRGFFVRAQRI